MPPRNKKKKKKSQQQRKNNKNKQRNQNKHQNRNNRAKNKNKTNNGYKNHPERQALQTLKRGYNELNIEYICELKTNKQNLNFKQETLGQCFDMIWKKCGNKMQCTEQILSKKLSLLETLITDFKLDLTLSQNFFSPKDSDTLYNRICLLCNKCLLPMLQFNIEFIELADKYHSSLKLLILQQLHYCLFDYIDNMGVKFETNALGIINMSWDNIIEPTLNKWWISLNNLQCKSVIPWSISQGVYLNVIFPYFSIFKDYILNKDEVLNIDGIDDKQIFNPLKLWLKEESGNIDGNIDGNIEELGIPKVVYKQLVISIGKSLLRRKRSCEDNDIVCIDRIYDCDLQYLYMCIADLFDEGRLRWLRTDDGVKKYQSYVTAVNQSIDEKYPLIGKIVTCFLIGNAGMIIV